MQRLILVPLLVLGLLLGGCGFIGNSSGGEWVSVHPTSSPATTPDSTPVQDSVLSADAVLARIESGDPVIIVDVRTAQEYAQGHISGALLIPNEDISDAQPALLPVLNSEILVYCRSGNRSAQAVQKLKDIGYTNVYDFGGIQSWPYETEEGAFELPEKSGSLSSFSAFDLNGVMRDESIFEDYDLTMINIWGTYCGPCLSEMPELGELAADYAGRGVQIIGIPFDVIPNSSGSYSGDIIETAQYLVQETGAAYTHLLPSDDLVSAVLIAVSAVPETVFVNSKGELVGKSYIGARSGQEWAQIIEATLGEVTK